MIGSRRAAAARGPLTGRVDQATTTIEIVFFDVGGVLYDDTVYARAWHRALREAGADFTDEEFEAEYAAARAAQSGSFRRRLMARFLPDGDPDAGGDRRAVLALPAVGSVRRRDPVPRAAPRHVSTGRDREPAGRGPGRDVADGLAGFFEVGSPTSWASGSPTRRCSSSPRRPPGSWRPPR